MKCPSCGSDLDITDLVPLNEHQRETLEAVRECARNDIRGTASTVGVAARIGYTERWAREWLKALEQLGLVYRPRGKKSGWKTREEHHTLVQLRIIERIAA